MGEHDLLNKKASKYFFDLHNFDEEHIVEPVIDEIPPPPVFNEDDMARSRREGFNEGKREGLNEAAASRERQVANLLDKVAQEVGVLFLAEDARMGLYETETVALAKSIFAKLFPALNAREALQETEYMIVQVLEEHRSQPEIRIEVHPDFCADIEAHITTILSKSHSSGKCLVIGHPDLSPGDCRMSWHSGGAERNVSSLSEKIMKIFDQTLGNRPLLRDNEPESENQGPAPTAPHEEI